MTFFDLLDTASNGLEAQRIRMDVVSKNIANSSTPGYKREIPILSQKNANSFSIIMARELGIKEADLMNFLSGKEPGKGIQVSQILTDRTPGPKVYMPQHPDADKDGYIEMSNVDPMKEMLEMMYAVRNYKANLSIVEMTKSAIKETFSIGKPGG